MKVGYIRVSTFDQNLERQEITMKKLGAERVYREKISGISKERPKLEDMLEFIREGDELIIDSVCRLGRSTRDLLSIVDKLKEKKVRLISHKENLDSETTIGKFMLTMLSALAELERERILERTKEGIAVAKSQGKYKGRKPIQIDESKWTNRYEQWKNGEITAVQFRKEIGVSHDTFYRKVRQWEQDAKINKAC